MLTGVGRPRGVDPDQLARIKAWVRASCGPGEESTVMVTELRCSEPGCSPLETVVAVLDAGRSVKHAIHKPLAEVVVSDIACLCARPRS